MDYRYSIFSDRVKDEFLSHPVDVEEFKMPLFAMPAPTDDKLPFSETDENFLFELCTETELRILHETEMTFEEVDANFCEINDCDKSSTEISYHTSQEAGGSVTTSHSPTKKSKFQVTICAEICKDSTNEQNIFGSESVGSVSVEPLEAIIGLDLRTRKDDNETQPTPYTTSVGIDEDTEYTLVKSHWRKLKKPNLLKKSKKTSTFKNPSVYKNPPSKKKFVESIVAGLCTDSTLNLSVNLKPLS